MLKYKMTHTVDLSGFDKLFEGLEDQIQEAIDQTLKDILRGCVATVPKQTGALAASHFIITPNINNFQESVSAARRLNDKTKFISEPELPAKQLTGIIGVSAAHGIVVHYGSARQDSKRVPARPWLAEQVANHHDIFYARIQDVVTYGRRKRKTKSRKVDSG